MPWSKLSEDDQNAFKSALSFIGIKKLFQYEELWNNTMQMDRRMRSLQEDCGYHGYSRRVAIEECVREFREELSVRRAKNRQKLPAGFNKNKGLRSVLPYPHLQAVFSASREQEGSFSELKVIESVCNMRFFPRKNVSKKSDGLAQQHLAVKP